MEKATRKEETISAKKQIAVAAVHASAAGLGAVLNNYKSDADKTAFLRAYVNAIRFYSDESGYFFLYKDNGLNIALPNPKEWEGKNLSDYKDSKGNLVIKELVEVTKKGGGFIEYYWLNPTTKTDQKKVAYAEAIPGTKYLIGTGYYVD